MKTWSLLGVGAILVGALGGCSGAPRDEGGAAATENAMVTPPAPTAFLGPDPGSFRSCTVLSTTYVPPIPPRFVLRLPDTDGQAYGFSDGYTLPFPTPWICPALTLQTQSLEAFSGDTLVPSISRCVYDPSVYAYEHALLSAVPSIPRHQYLVYELDPNPTRAVLAGVAMAEYDIAGGGRQWFLNGSLDASDGPAIEQVVSDYKSSEAVDPSFLRCVYVLQVGSNGTLQYTGIHGPVAQRHDPVNWPD